MTRVAGITIERNRCGVPSYARISLNKYGNNTIFEDFLDGLEADAARNEESYDWNEAVKILDRKHGI